MTEECFGTLFIGLSKIARGFVKIHGGIRGGVMNPTVGE